VSTPRPLGTVNRREFLRISATAGGAMVITVTLCRPAGSAGRRGGRAAELNAFVRIDPDDTITIVVAKSEMGQGVRTSLPRLVAEELDADWSKVRIEQAVYHASKYGGMGTGGSGSVRTSWDRLRRAGASVRAMLIAAAAQSWGVPEGECRTEASLVIHDATGRRARYGTLAEQAALLPIPSSVRLKPRGEWRLLGKDARGVDVADIVRGTARYGIDVKVPGMLYASVERTAVFGGKVRSFDPSATLRVPGVKQVVEIPAIANGINVHAGIAVVAENTWAALQGRRKLSVEWDPGLRGAESSESYAAAMKAALERPGAERVNHIGSPDTMLNDRNGVITAVFEMPFLAHATMEPMNCTAHVRPGAIEIWSPTQHPNWATPAVASTLKVDPATITMHVTLLGGGYGRRINPDFTVEAGALTETRWACPGRLDPRGRSAARLLPALLDASHRCPARRRRVPCGLAAPDQLTHDRRDLWSETRARLGSRRVRWGGKHAVSDSPPIL